MTRSTFPRRTMTDLGQLAAVRADFADWLGSNTDRDDKIDELAVVLSELGANALRATPPGASDPMVEAWVEDRTLTLLVENFVAEGAEPDVDWDFENPLRTGGRGLVLVSAFVDEVQVGLDGDLLSVHCTAEV